MKRKDIDNVHDKGFKEFYQRKEAIIDLVENVLGLNFGEKLKEEHLSLIETKSYYDELKEQESDVVYLIKVDEKEILLYLFLELQSTIDYRMPARLLFYMIGQLQRYYLGQNFKPTDTNMKLPVLYPVVLYNGIKPWDASTNLRHLFKN
ncbi:MAG: Rpn family recombination-promoting nuclease/putative transposase, partial [Turicibacter sp.]